MKKILIDIAPYQHEIISHPLYRNINSITALRIFMEHHVYAVWDFMSLVKALQQHITCVNTPWMPVSNGNLRFLINEIVLGEESDIDKDGLRKSHFEMYIEAMHETGASTMGIMKLIDDIKEGTDVKLAIQSNKFIPAAAKDFMYNTFRIIRQGNPHILAAVFTYGREDLIPTMFKHIVNDIERNMGINMDRFIYYLDRHIEVDGDHHSSLAIEMTEELCGNNETKWKEAIDEVKVALTCRRNLWQSAFQAIMQINKPITV